MAKEITPPCGIGKWGMTEEELREKGLSLVNPTSVKGGIVWEVECYTLPKKFPAGPFSENLIYSVVVDKEEGLTSCRVVKMYKDLHLIEDDFSYFTGVILPAEYDKSENDVWRIGNSQISVKIKNNSLVVLYEAKINKN